MLRVSFVALLFFHLVSCKPLVVETELTDSDSVAINFFKPNSPADSVGQVVIVRDSLQIRKLAAFLEPNNISSTGCKYDGNLNFFKFNRVVKRVDFSFNTQGCRKFSFILNDVLVYSKLTKEAEDFLISLKK